MSNAKPTLMLIDGHSLAFRAFYALPPESFQTKEGQHTNAIHGFISMLLNLLQNEGPDALAVAFDISRHSFRTEEYPEYKGTRGATPPEFKGQVPLLQDALQAMGIVTLEKANYEADDILATLATQGADQGYNVLVVSGDRDTIQLVDDRVTLLYPSKGGVRDLMRYTPETVKEKYGVPPEQYPEIAALVGETSDNLPGVPKVGPKTALKWILQFGSLDELLRRQDEVGGKVGESLRENAHLAERNRRLNRLVRDVDLPVEVADLTRADIDMERVKDVFGKLEFRSITARVAKLAAGSSGQPKGADSAESGGEAPEAENAVEPPKVELPPARLLLDEELDAWLQRAKRPALVIDPDHMPMRVGLATETERVQFDWTPGARDTGLFEQWLTSDLEKIVWDGKSVFKFLAEHGIELRAIAGDAQLAAWMLRPTKLEKTLVGAVQAYLDEELPTADPTALLPNEGDEQLVSHHAWCLARLHSTVSEQLPEPTRAVYSDIEVPVLPVLAKMETRGVAIDREVLESQLAELTDAVRAAEQRAFECIGREVNLASPKQLQDVLFTQLEMPLTRKTKSGYSTDAKALAELQQKAPHPFLDALLEHRDVNKLRQIVETLLKAVQEDGRIHTTLLQLGASTGRLASENPNLQNIPARTETGRRIREGFTHGEEFDVLLTADYSQIEMRIMADASGDAGLIEAFQKGEDLHRFVGSRIFEVAPEDVTTEMRSKVKAMSYGLAYGLSAFGLSQQLGISPAEAKQLMADYFRRFGGVRDYLHEVVEEAKKNGYTETVFGRRRPFPELKSPNRAVRTMAERAALNAPIQGAAADIMKIAMIRIENRMREADMRSRMLLQIHDELMFEVVADELETLETLVREEMGAAAKLAVPLDVSVGTGANWNAAQH